MEIHKCMHTSNLFKYVKKVRKNIIKTSCFIFLYSVSVPSILCSDKYVKAVIKMCTETCVGLHVKVVVKTVQSRLILTML
jgi:hypothetical protein